MFDISLFEMVVIGVVALIVIGPERLPGVARTLGHLFGRMQRYVNEVKSDIQREIELDELRKLRQSVEESAREIEQSVSREFDRAEQEMRELQALVEPKIGPDEPKAAQAAESSSEPVVIPDEAKVENIPADPRTPAPGQETSPQPAAGEAASPPADADQAGMRQRAAAAQDAAPAERRA